MAKQKTTDEFQAEIDKLTNYAFTIESEYKGSKHKIILKHNHCGKTFVTTPNLFLSRGTKCRICATEARINSKLKQKNFYKLIKEKFNGEYYLIAKYINEKTFVIVKHKTCNREFPAYPQDILENDMPCPYCKAERNNSTAK